MELIKLFLACCVMASLTSATYYRRQYLRPDLYQGSRRHDEKVESKPGKSESTLNVNVHGLPPSLFKSPVKSEAAGTAEASEFPVMYIDEFGTLRQGSLRPGGGHHGPGGHEGGSYGEGGHGSGGGHGGGGGHGPGYHPPTLGYQGIVPFYGSYHVSGGGPLLPLAGNVIHPGGPHGHGVVYAVPFVPAAGGLHPETVHVPGEVTGPYPGTAVPGSGLPEGVPPVFGPLIQLFQRPLQFIGMLLRPPPNRPVPPDQTGVEVEASPGFGPSGGFGGGLGGLLGSLGFGGGFGGTAGSAASEGGAGQGHPGTVVAGGHKDEQQPAVGHKDEQPAVSTVRTDPETAAATEALGAVESRAGGVAVASAVNPVTEPVINSI